MKRLLLVGVVGLACGSATAKYETRQSESKFDGVITKSSTPALFSCNEWKELCPFLTLITTSRDDMTVGLKIGLNSSGRYYNFSHLALNIDGIIVEFKNLSTTDFEYKQYINQNYSSAVFVAPRSIVDEMKSAKIILVKITALDGTRFERSMLEDGKESKAYKALKAFNP